MYHIQIPSGSVNDLPLKQVYEKIMQQCLVSAFKCECINYSLLSDLKRQFRQIFVVDLCVRFGKCWRSSGFGQNRSRSCDRCRSVPDCGDDLALGVEKQLWGDSLDLETVEGERGCCSPSSQRGWVNQQGEGPYYL